MKKTFSRAQMNKNVRQILSSNQIDLSQVQFTCTQHAINLTGSLVKIDGSQLSPQQAQRLVDELMKENSFITSTLEEWDLNGGSVRKIEKREVKKKEK